MSAKLCNGILTLTICLMGAGLLLASPALFMLLATLSPMLVLFAVSLAIAGAGNRLGWAAVCAVLTLPLAGLASVLTPTGENHGLAMGIVLCAAVPLVPALILWLAYLFGNWRGRTSALSKENKETHP